MASTKKEKKADTQAEASLPLQKRRLAFVPGLSGLPTFYVNNIQVDMTNHDVRLRLGQVYSASNELIEIQNVAVVYMSHTHFKATVEAFVSTFAKMQQQARGDAPKD